MLLLFTGLRRQEAAQLTWNQIDFAGKTLKVIDTKNHLDHSLPLSDYLYNLLLNRHQTSTSLYVFPSNSQGGYIIEPRRQIAKVIQNSNVTFTIHDLRRTFITIAESLDISAYAVKRLLNHKMTSDVTAGYIMNDVERLRKPMQLSSKIPSLNISKIIFIPLKLGILLLINILFGTLTKPSLKWGQTLSPKNF